MKYTNIRYAEETGYHAVVTCTKAAALRHALRKNWELPMEEQLRWTGPDWLLLLPSSIRAEIKAKMLLLLWRAWHLHNDTVHGKGTASITGSVKFLTSYCVSLGLTNNTGSPKQNEKGKSKVFADNLLPRCENAATAAQSGKCQKWTAPPEGWVKLNTDAGFCLNTGEASAGIVVRDAAGAVILTSWRMLRRCGSPEEAEACLEGLRLTAE
jgi:hypothetical protein